MHSLMCLAFFANLFRHLIKLTVEVSIKSTCDFAEKNFFFYSETLKVFGKYAIRLMEC